MQLFKGKVASATINFSVMLSLSICSVTLEFYEFSVTTLFSSLGTLQAKRETVNLTTVTD